MRKLIVYMATSLDGYIADNKGSYDWLAENLRELDLTTFRKKSPILKECEGANSTNE